VPSPSSDLLHLAQAVYSNADMTAIRFRLVNQWTLEQICPSNSPSRLRQSSGLVFEIMLLICGGAKGTRTHLTGPEEARLPEGRQRPAQGLAHPAQAPVLPWRAGQLAKAIHILQAREIAG
jgi:hypothetical protein